MLSHNFLTCDGGGEPGADVGFFLRRKEVSARQARAAMQTAVLPVNLHIKKNRTRPSDARSLLDFFASQKGFEEAHEITA